MNAPILDLIMLPTHNSQVLAIADASYYPATWNIVIPTLQITPPSFPTVTISFVAKNIMTFNSDTLGVTCTSEGGCLTELPDGLYKVVYTINPAYKYSVEKFFLRTDKIYSKLDDAYLKLDLFQCDGQLKAQYVRTLEDIEYYIEGAIAAGNKCAQKLSTELYNKALKMLTAFNNGQCCTL